MRDDAIFASSHPAFSLVDYSECRFERHHVVADKPQHRVSEFRTPQEGSAPRRIALKHSFCISSLLALDLKLDQVDLCPQRSWTSVGFEAVNQAIR